MRMFCTDCLDEREVEYSTRQETIVVRGEPIEIESKVAHCLTCGNEVLDTELADETLRSAYEVFREKHGLLSPEEIREIRMRYGLSHRALSRLMGWGLVTTQRYEHGALQDEAHDAILRQMRDDPSFVLAQWEKNKDRLCESESRKLEQRLSELVAGGAALLIRAFQNEEVLAHSRNPESRGFRAFDFGKTKQVVLFFATRLPNLFETKLAKLLWVADFANYLESGKSMTGLAYARLPHGPAPHRFSVLLALMEDSGAIMREHRESDTYAGTVILPWETSLSFDELSSDEVQLLERVIKKYGRFSGGRLSRMSHLESIWADRTDGSLLPYSDACTAAMARGL